MANTYSDPVVTDFSAFGYRERKLAAELLTASIDQGFPEDFQDDGVQIAMNTNSGFVFFTNADYQVAMMNGDKLESFYSCPECGHEGFKDSMKHGVDNKHCCAYLQDIGVIFMPEEMDGDESAF